MRQAWRSDAMVASMLNKTSLTLDNMTVRHVTHKSCFQSMKYVVQNLLLE